MCCGVVVCVGLGGGVGREWSGFSSGGSVVRR